MLWLSTLHLAEPQVYLAQPELQKELERDRMRARQGGTTKGMYANQGTVQAPQPPHENPEANKRQAEERAAMMRKTVGSLGGSVGKGVGDMGHAVGGVSQRVTEMGRRVWDSASQHPAKQVASSVPGMEYFMTIPDHSPAPSAAETAMQKAHSNLCPTAPEFVPHSRVHVTEREEKEHPDRSSDRGDIPGSRSWWPTTASNVSGPPLTEVMKGVKEKVEGYLHSVGHAGEESDKGEGERKTSTAPSMDTLTSQHTRAPGVDDNAPVGVHDRVVDAHETIGFGTPDTTNDDEEEMLKKVHDAEEMLERAEEPPQ
ncbi:hypothetical protein NMY22_g19501 [Coprinellus aureogranulatus]|nr:hypothetical protein NMY22_g19501 [Coprinellus aureogranulatus]